MEMSKNGVRRLSEIGSIEVGKKADLVVLDQNIFKVHAYDIHKIQIALTMMDGDIVYEASIGSETVVPNTSTE